MIEVRNIEEKDLEKIMNWRMRPDITKWMNSDPVLTLEKQLQWFRNIQSDDSVRYWMIVIDGEDAGIINIAITGEDSVIWGYYVAEKSKRTMLNAISIEMSLYRYCFECLDLKTVTNEALAINKGVIQLHKICGNDILEERKDAVEKNGKLYDVVVMSIDSDRWYEIEREIEFEHIDFQKGNKE